MQKSIPGETTYVPLLTTQDRRTALPAALPLPCPPQSSIPRPAERLKHGLKAWAKRQEREKG